MRTFALTPWRQIRSSGCLGARFVVVFVTLSNEGLEGLGRPGPTEPLGSGLPAGQPRPTAPPGRIGPWPGPFHDPVEFPPSWGRKIYEIMVFHRDARAVLGALAEPGWPGTTPARSDLDELDAGELAEVPPRRGVVAQVHHLVVRPARRQPPVQAVPHPGRRAELAIGHLKRREFLGVQVLTLGDDHAEPRALQRDQRGQGRRAGLILEQERRRVPE